MSSFDDTLNRLKAAAKRQFSRAAYTLGEAENQIESIRQMGRSNDPKNAPLLVQMLANHHPVMVRCEAALALGALRSGEATLPLMELLEESSEALENAATTALGQIGDERAIKALVAMLKHPVDATKRLAAEAIAKLGPNSIKWIAELMKRSSFDTRIAAAYALGQFQDERAFRALERSMGDTDSAVRREVAASLGNQSRACAARLAPQLEAPNPLVRHTAALALAKFRSPDTAAPLAQALAAEPDEEVREAFWEALAACGSPQAARRMKAKQALNKGDWEEAQCFGTDAADVFIEAFRAGDREERKKAEAMLAKLAPRGPDALTRALSDSEREVRRLAARVLASAGWSPATEHDELRLAIAAGNYPKAAAPAAIPILLWMLADRNDYEREAATETLGKINDPAAVEALAKAARDGDCRVRERAAKALGRFRCERSREILQRLAADPHFIVAAAARSAMANS